MCITVPIFVLCKGIEPLFLGRKPSELTVILTELRVFSGIEPCFAEPQSAVLPNKLKTPCAESKGIEPSPHECESD